MATDLAAALGIGYALCEGALSLGKRAQSGTSRSADRGSLRLLWIVISASMTLGFLFAANFHGASIGDSPALRQSGVGLFAAGVLLRLASIVYLGRFFTVDVAIAADHQLIERGPYRFIRHPSYSGALGAFAGLSLCLANWAAFAVIMVPVTLVFMHRIDVEEAALRQAFGERYRDYAARTKRLVPGLY